jgi:type I restriction enzyme S subunit
MSAQAAGLPDGWTRTTLAAVLTGPRDLTYGIVQPGAHDPEGVPIVRVTDIRNGRVAVESPMRVGGAVAAPFQRSQLRGGELLLTLVGTVGECAVAPKELQGWNTARAVGVARIKPEVGADWVALCLRSREVQDRISARVNTTVQTTLNLKEVRELPIVLPHPAELSRIREFVAALDDRIGSNRRLIENVQHLSVACFRAWRSSCNDTVATTFGDFCDVHGGSTPRTDEPRNWGGPYWWATPTDLTALPAPYLFGTARTVTDHGLRSSSAALHPPGTILMTSRATIGAFAVNQEACATNQGFICARPRHDRDRWFLFEEMRMRVPEMLDRANGSTFLELSRRNFKEMILQVPSERDLDRLTGEVEPLHRLAA